MAFPIPLSLFLRCAGLRLLLSPGLVRFTPKGGVLKAGTAKAFSLTINPVGMASGIFQVEISVSINNGAPSPLAPQVIVTL